MVKYLMARINHYFRIDNKESLDEKQFYKMYYFNKNFKI